MSQFSQIWSESGELKMKFRLCQGVKGGEEVLVMTWQGKLGELEVSYERIFKSFNVQ